MTFNWNSCSIKSKQTVMWRFRWVDQNIRIDNLLFCWLKGRMISLSECMIRQYNNSPWAPGYWRVIRKQKKMNNQWRVSSLHELHPIKKPHHNAYRELNSTIHQVGQDGVFRLPWWYCLACTALTRWTRAQAQMSAVHLKASVKHVRLHHNLHGVRVTVDHDRSRPRAQLRALLQFGRSQWRLDVTMSPAGHVGVSCAGASAVD